MKRKKGWNAVILSALMLVAFFVSIDRALSGPENLNWSKVVFYVG